LVQSDSFGTFNGAAPKNNAELDQWIVDSWDRLRERWDSISNRYLKMNVSDARSKWMVPLFKELGFDPGFLKEEIVVDGDDKLNLGSLIEVGLALQHQCCIWSSFPEFGRNWRRSPGRSFYGGDEVEVHMMNCNLS